MLTYQVGQGLRAVSPVLSEKGIELMTKRAKILTILFSALVSYPVYIVLNNIIINLLHFILGYSFHLYIFGSYCQLDDPDFEIDSQSLIFLICFYIIKLAIVGFSILYYKNGKHFNILKLFIVVILLNCITIDTISLISYFFDSILNTYTFKFFFSGASIYMLESQIGLPRYSLTLFTALIGFYIPFFVMKKFKLLKAGNIILYFLSLLLSILVIAFLFNIFAHLSFNQI